MMKRMMWWGIFLYICVCYFRVQSFTKPVLLVPGLGASVLLQKNGNRVYPPSISDFLFQNRKWKKKMTYDDLQTYDMGDKRSIELHLPYFLNKNHYSELIKQENVYPIPYDFRRIHLEHYLQEWCNKLREYVENRQNNIPVVFLAHSTGGILIHWFLSQQSPEWLKKHVERVIFVSVPFSGLYLAVKCILQPSFFERCIGNTEMFQNMGGLLINIPPDIMSIEIVSGHMMKTSSLLKIEIKDEVIEHIKKIRNSLKTQLPIDTYIVYADGIQTMVGLQTYEDGDGVVSRKSLLDIPMSWSISEIGARSERRQRGYEAYVNMVGFHNSPSCISPNLYPEPLAAKDIRYTHSSLFKTKSFQDLLVKMVESPEQAKDGWIAGVA